MMKVTTIDNNNFIIIEHGEHTKIFATCDERDTGTPFTGLTSLFVNNKNYKDVTEKYIEVFLDMYKNINISHLIHSLNSATKLQAATFSQKTAGQTNFNPIKIKERTKLSTKGKSPYGFQRR